MKPLPSATITCSSGSPLSTATISLLKISVGTTMGLESLICTRRATVGKNASATAGACLMGQAWKAWHMMSRPTNTRIGAITARGISSTMNPT